MNLNCPSCGTRFRLPDGALGDTGRKLRCAACKHVWFQTPVEIVPAPEPVVPETQELQASAPVAATPSPVVTPEPEQASAPAAGEEPDQPSSAPASPPFIATRPAEQEKPGAVKTDAPTGDNVLPHPGQPGDDDRQGDGLRPTLPLPAQENEKPPKPAYDISRVVTSDSAPEEDQGRKGGSWLFKLFLLLVIAGFLFTGYQWRGNIMAMAPWTISTYEMAGLIGAPTSLGLEYRDVAFSVDEQNGYSQLSISGRVVNVSNEFVRLPEMRAELLDEFGATLLVWSFTASAGGLGPDDQTLFRSTYPDPPRTGDEFYLFMTFEDTR